MEEINYGISINNHCSKCERISSICRKNQITYGEKLMTVVYISGLIVVGVIFKVLMGGY